MILMFKIHNIHAVLSLYLFNLVLPFLFFFFVTLFFFSLLGFKACAMKKVFASWLTMTSSKLRRTKIDYVVKHQTS